MDSVTVFLVYQSLGIWSPLRFFFSFPETVYLAFERLFTALSKKWIIYPALFNINFAWETKKDDTFSLLHPFLSSPPPPSPKWWKMTTEFSLSFWLSIYLPIYCMAGRRIFRPRNFGWVLRNEKFSYYTRPSLVICLIYGGATSCTRCRPTMSTQF